MIPIASNSVGVFVHMHSLGPSLAPKGRYSLLAEARRTSARPAPIHIPRGLDTNGWEHIPRTACRCALSKQSQQPSGQQPGNNNSSRRKRRPSRQGPPSISSHEQDSTALKTGDSTQQDGSAHAASLPQQQQPEDVIGQECYPFPDQCDDPDAGCANIEYTVSSSVGSYTDPGTCAVSYNDVSSNGYSSGSGQPHWPATGGTSHLDADAVRGLVYGATVRFSDSAALRLRRRAMVVWEQCGPKRVLLVKKPVPAAAAMLREMAQWLEGQGLQVFVEQSVHQSELPQFTPFCPTSTGVDFAITLGGDGTVLHLASLFEEDVPLPPVMCFAMGSLGFLTPFDAAAYRACLERVLAANRQPLYCTLRTRKRCVVLDRAGHQLRVHHILNECVVDR
eukprot:GHUV01017796.1.p1 GENE.GHUV01017796.1~~GHUV01017796.1.p1  ORF type:complete len:392 (+),score=79.94 GHUV01017796.1:503-1678(+)